MLQPNGTVIFPIKLPQGTTNANVTNTAVKGELKSKNDWRESKRRTTPHNFTSAWSCTVQYFIGLIGLIIVQRINTATQSDFNNYCHIYEQVFEFVKGSSDELSSRVSFKHETYIIYYYSHHSVNLSTFR